MRLPKQIPATLLCLAVFTAGKFLPTMPAAAEPAGRAVRAHLDQFDQTRELLSLLQIVRLRFADPKAFRQALRAAADKTGFIRKTIAEIHLDQTGEPIPAGSVRQADLLGALYLNQRPATLASLRDWLFFAALQPEQQAIGWNLASLKSIPASGQRNRRQDKEIRQGCQKIASLLAVVSQESLAIRVSAWELSDWLLAVLEDPAPAENLAQEIADTPQTAWPQPARTAVIPRLENSSRPKADYAKNLNEAARRNTRVTHENRTFEDLIHAHRLFLRNEQTDPGRAFKDPSGRITRIEGIGGARKTFTYAKGSRVEVRAYREAGRQDSQAVYAQGRLRRVLFTSGDTLSLTYDKTGGAKSGTVTVRVTRDGAERVYTYGGQGKLRTVMQKNGSRMTVMEQPGAQEPLSELQE